MSQVVDASEIRELAAGIERQQVMDIVRGATFVGTLLLGWISLHPFESLGDMQIGDVSTGNELATYAMFGALSVLTIALAMRNDARGLATLLSPAFVLFGAWLLVTVVLSFDPGTSIKRLSLTICVVAVTAALMLLPKSQQELMHWFTIAALALLAICYLGILLAPDLSVHLATDPQEPGLAGNWRGAFGHKNQAAAIMVMVLFLGVYIIRSGLWISGAAIIALASLFLLYSAGKSSLTLCFAVLLLTSVTSVIRSFWLRAIILLTPLLLLNFLSVGTVMFEGLAGISKLLPFNSTFTGRTDIWAFALQSLQARLLTGYGFAVLLGQQRDSKPAGRQGVGRLRRAQPQWLSRHRAGHGRSRACLAHPGAGDPAFEEFSARGRGRQQRSAGHDAAADLVVRALSVGDGKLLPRPFRSVVVHVPDGGVRPALSRAVSGEGLRELRAHRFGNILPPAVEIEWQRHR